MSALCPGAGRRAHGQRPARRHHHGPARGQGVHQGDERCAGRAPAGEGHGAARQWGDSDRLACRPRR
eukprot:7161383-Pyramimonas_sp.AAC.1